MVVMLGFVDLLRAVRGTVSLSLRGSRAAGVLAAFLPVAAVVVLWLVVWIPADTAGDRPAGAAPRESTQAEVRSEPDESATPTDGVSTSSTTGAAVPGTDPAATTDPGGATSGADAGSEPGGQQDASDGPTQIEPGTGGNTTNPTSPPSSSPTTPPTTPGGTTTTTAPPSGNGDRLIEDLLDLLGLG